MNAMKSFY